MDAKKKEEAILRIFAKESLNLAGHEGTDYTLAWRSLGLERRHDGRAMMANRRWQRGFEVVLLELREEGRRVGMGASSMAGHEGTGYTL
jgi:hypothetical protein